MRLEGRFQTFFTHSKISLVEFFNMQEVGGKCLTTSQVLKNSIKDAKHEEKL